MTRFYKQLGTIKALSFDLDDTLYANAPVIAAAEVAMLTSLQRHKPQLTHNDIAYWQLQRQLVAAQNPQLRHDVSQWRLVAVEQGLQAQDVSHCEAQELSELAVSAFLEARTTIQVTHSTVQLLEQLASRFPLVAITNGNADIQKMGLAHCFQFALRAGPDGRMKPYPDLFETAARRLQLSTQHILHIGDHVRSDVLGALNAGCMAAWLNPAASIEPRRQAPPLVLPHLELASLDALLLLGTQP